LIYTNFHSGIEIIDTNLYYLELILKEKNMDESSKKQSFLPGNFLGIRWREWITLAIFFAGMFLILSKYAGGPLVSDDFYYLDTGLNGIKDLPVLFY
jgi:hypothetical protein